MLRGFPFVLGYEAELLRARLRSNMHLGGTFPPPLTTLLTLERPLDHTEYLTQRVSIRIDKIRLYAYSVGSRHSI